MTTKNPEKIPHAIARASERYGIDVTIDNLKQAEKDCRDKTAVFVAQEYNGAERFFVKIGDKVLIAVYKRLRDRIITFLPATNVPLTRKYKKKKPRKYRTGRRARPSAVVRGAKQEPMEDF